MRSLIHRNRRASLRDPAPSKWGYRFQRLLLTPGFVGLIRIGTPMLLLCVIGFTWFSDPENVAMMNAKVAEVKASIQERPEFQVTELTVAGAGPVLEADVRRVLPIAFPVSSFDLDLEDMRSTVAALYAVDDVSIRINESGSLLIAVEPRLPVALWRASDNLHLIDSKGEFAGVIAMRSDRLDLPLIVGDGAHDHIQEALALFRNAGPLATRVRGLVRMGERRWDIVLDRGQKIMLPEVGAATALDRVIALDQTNELLERDIVTIDLRNTARATVQMSAEAASALRRVKDTGLEN